MTDNMLNINIKIPNKLSIYKEDIETIIHNDEEVIKKYLERTIFNCVLSETVKRELDKIFVESKKIVLEKF